MTENKTGTNSQKCYGSCAIFTLLIMRREKALFTIEAEVMSMVYLDASQTAKIQLGWVGENAHRTIRFREAADIISMYPDASVAVLNRRPGDQAAYEVLPQFVEIRNGAVYWQIMSGDLTEEGTGKCELVFTSGGVIAKTMIYTTEVQPSLDGSGEPPEPWDEWQETVISRIQAMQSVTPSNPFAVYDNQVGSGTGNTEETWVDDDGTHTAVMKVLYVDKPNGYGVKAGDLVLAKVKQDVTVADYSFFGLSMGGDEIEEHPVLNIGREEYPAGTVMFKKDRSYLFRARSNGTEAGFDIIWGP